MYTAESVTLAIPTYNRGPILLDTLRLVFQLEPKPREILVVDQTVDPPADVALQLLEWHDSGIIRWIKQQPPSIPAAMNRALLEAQCDIVLFLDDDVVPSRDLVAAHISSYTSSRIWGVVGQVLQPGQHPIDLSIKHRAKGLWEDLDFAFNNSRRCDVVNCMAGNLSVRRKEVIQIGGFDENFVRVAHRFETEFARRVIGHGGRILFEPKASLRHLQVGVGGTRAYCSHLRTTKPDHAVGDYYFALRVGKGREKWQYIVWRFFRSIRTRFHLTRPWWIPVKLFSEIRGLIWAKRLATNGPKLIHGTGVRTSCVR